MRYLPAINIWAPGVTEALRSGALRLLPGQWIRCGEGHPSRFSHVSDGGVIVAYHYPDHSRKFLAVKAAHKTAEAFLRACKAKREADLKAAEALAEQIRAQVIHERLRAQYFGKEA